MSIELIKEKKLVFIQKNDVFTNSKIIASGAGISHKQLKKVIRNYKQDIEFFGKLSVAYVTESTGGRPEEIQPLNEQQATFVITLLKNTPKVLDFKKELVRQFYLMREELRKLQTAKTIFLEARRTLTDSINALPESGHKGRKYKHYTDLLYKIVIGKNAAQIRKELGLGEGQSVVGFLSAEQYNEIAKLEEQAAMLIDMGFEYEQIKSGLYKMYEKMKNNKLLPDQTRLVGV